MCRGNRAEVSKERVGQRVAERVELRCVEVSRTEGSRGKQNRYKWREKNQVELNKTC